MKGNVKFELEPGNLFTEHSDHEWRDWTILNELRARFTWAVGEAASNQILQGEARNTITIALCKEGFDSPDAVPGGHKAEDGWLADWTSRAWYSIGVCTYPFTGTVVREPMFGTYTVKEDQ